MPRVQALAAWCCGTAVSAGIAWFGVAVAVDSAVSPGARIEVPVRATLQPTEQPTGQPTGQPTEQPTEQPTGQPTGRETTPAQASPRRTARPTQRAGRDDGSVVARTVRGGSATFSVGPTGVALLSATPAPGYTPRIVRQYSYRNGTARGSIEVRFEGRRSTSAVTVTWTDDAVDVTTSDG